MLEAIRRLPDRRREALVPRYYLELDEGDIARSMGAAWHSQVHDIQGARRAPPHPRGRAMDSLEDRIRTAIKAAGDTGRPGSVPPSGVWLLDVTKPGSGLLASSHQVISLGAAPLRRSPVSPTRSPAATGQSSSAAR